MRWVAGALLVASVGLAASGCGDEGSAPAARPPSEFEALAAIFDPVVEPLGLTITRASLVDLDTYDESERGNHLALYVEPTDPYTDADYVDGVAELTNLLTPLIFQEWSAIDSYDICQEPRPGDDDRAAPPPMSQVFATRSQAAAIDFPITLAELRALYEQRPRGIERVYVDPRLADTAEWRAADPRR